MPMYRRHSKPVIELKEAAIKHIAENIENGEEFARLLCEAIQLDSLLQTLPYNAAYRADLKKTIEELNGILSSKAT